MFRKILLTCLLVAGVMNVQAHEGKTPEQRADAVTNRLEKQLALSADQKTKVHDLALARAKKMKDLREKYKDQDKKLWQAERKKVRDEFHSGMKATLSAEQFAKWEAQRKKQIDKKKNKQKGKGKGKGKKGTSTGTSDATDDSEVGDENDDELDG